MIVVFDFDHTLTRWDMSERFFRWLIQRQAWRSLLFGVAYPVLVLLLQFKATAKYPARFGIWLATLGRGVDDLPKLSKQYVHSLRQQRQNPFYEDAIEQLRVHKAQGDTVLVATGCVTELTIELLHSIGYGQVPVVGTSLKPFLGGLVRDVFCFREVKVTLLAGRGYPPPWDAAYSDHYFDLPLFMAAKERFVINPTPGTLKRIESELGEHFSVLFWR